MKRQIQSILRVIMLLCMNYDKDKLLSELFRIWKEAGFSTKI